MGKPKFDTNQPPVASIHTHFNLFRPINDKTEGPITLTEQIKAVERFVNWHERQVQVGKALMHRLINSASIKELIDLPPSQEITRHVTDNLPPVRDEGSTS